MDDDGGSDDWQWWPTSEDDGWSTDIDGITSDVSVQLVK